MNMYVSITVPKNNMLVQREDNFNEHISFPVCAVLKDDRLPMYADTREGIENVYNMRSERGYGN